MYVKCISSLNSTLNSTVILGYVLLLLEINAKRSYRRQLELTFALKFAHAAASLGFCAKNPVVRQESFRSRTALFCARFVNLRISVLKQ